MGEAEFEPGEEDRATREEEDFAHTLGSLSPRVLAMLDEHRSYNEGLVFIFFLAESISSHAGAELRIQRNSLMHGRSRRKSGLDSRKILV